MSKHIHRWRVPTFPEPGEHVLHARCIQGKCKERKDMPANYDLLLADSNAKYKRNATYAIDQRKPMAVYD